MELQNGIDELEMIDADSQKVASMLRGLPRVEAPANFEFRVKAGIARGDASRFAFLPFFRTAAPFALILLVASFGLLYYQRPAAIGSDPGETSMSGMAPSAAPTESATAVAPVVSAPSRESAAPTVERVLTESRRSSGTQRTVSRTSGSRPQGGSVDRIIHPANVIMPPGFEAANPQNRNANAAASTTSTPVADILGMFGIEGDFAAGGGWKVRSVKENSYGSRATIAAGDVIESIDGQPVKNEMSLKDGGKKFTVRRDGKTVTLSLGN
jgi:hypothetical protein